MKEKFVNAALSVCFVTVLLSAFYWLGYKGGEMNIKNSYHLVSDFICPVDAENIIGISDTQGLRDVIEVEGLATSGMFHNGIDYAVKDKTPVKAAKSGKVITCYPSYYNGRQWKGHKSYGGLIVIYHYDKTVSLYAHLSRTDVKEGDLVRQGEQIGLSGGVRGRRGSGVSTNCHLHFSIYMNIEELLENADI